MRVRLACHADRGPGGGRRRRGRPARGEQGAATRLVVLAVAGVGGLALLLSGGGLPAVLSGSGDAKAGTPKESNTSPAYGQLPMSFEANKGQTDDQVRYMAHGSGYTMFLTPTEAVLSLSRPAAAAGGGAAPSTDASVVRMKFLGANPEPGVAGTGPLPGKANYFTGADPAGWRTDVPTYGKVRYTGLYPGVDLVYHGTKSRLEYDFVVAPGADPNQIALGFEGAKSVALDSGGDLLLSTGEGTLRQARPHLYQDVDGKRRAVTGSFVLNGANRVGFSVGAYDTSRPLVIDPTLAYSTFLGGNGSDVGFGIAVDSSGNAYVGGQTTSTNFPTSGSVTCSSTAFPTSSYQCDRPGTDAFVTKLNAAGTGLVYSTYLGGDRTDLAYRIAIDAGGDAYVIGVTDSADDPGTTAVEAGFPTTANAYDTTCGTDGYCNAKGVVPPSTSGCPSGGCPTLGLGDAFVTRLNAAGSALVYSTFLGGSDQDQDVALTAVPSMMGIAVSGTKAYVTGGTGSADFPTTSGAYQSTCGTAAIAGCDGGRLDAFFSVLDTSSGGAASLTYSSYLGGTGNDEAKAVAIGDNGVGYIAGTTSGYGSPVANNLPTKSAFQATYQGGSADAFVAAFDPSQSGEASLKYSTYLGGGGFDHAWGLAVAGKLALVTGQTDSGDDPSTPAADGPTPYFPTTAGAFDTTYNGRATDPGGDTTFLNGDAFVTEIKKDGNELAYSTFLGGTDMDVGGAIAVDQEGQAYVTGYTTCEKTVSTGPPCTGSFPVTPGAIQSTMDGSFLGVELHNSPTDIFVAKLLADGRGLAYATYLGGNDFDRGFAIAVRDTDATGAAIVPEAYVTGRIASTNYPVTAGAFQTTKPAGRGNRDAAVSKVVG